MIKLSEIRDALYDVSMGTSCYFNTKTNDSLRNELFNATRCKGAFHRFREIIDYRNITNDWYKFQDDEYKKIAEEWCTDNKIEYEKDC